MPDLDPVTAQLLGFAEALAEVSRTLLSQAATRGTSFADKADSSFVTETDRVIEARLRELIADAYPAHGILGEEFGSSDLGADLSWVLDPIDGTAHFVTGIPVYGTLIGLSRAGAPWLGVLDYPATGDRWVGVEATLARRNGTPVRTRDCHTLGAALATCSNPDFFQPTEAVALNRIRQQVRYTMYGASSFGHATLAGGRTDLAVDSGLKPYDVFAPAAVISGAGGTMTQWSGAPLSLHSTGPVVAAGTTELHAAARELLG